MCRESVVVVDLVLLVARKLDNAIHRINHYALDSMICSLIHWIAIYSVNNFIQPLSNRSLVVS